MPKQLALPIKARFRHGGARPGAGRPRGTGLQSHVRRARLSNRHPVHVTLRLRSGLPSLRSKAAFRCFRDAVRTARRRGFQVSHFALLSNHVHLILEPSEPSLRPLFQSLCISFSKRLNARLGSRGPVFLGRYHLHVLKTPTEVKRALAYVLTNEHIHGKRAGTGQGVEVVQVRVDPFSSAWGFRDLRKLIRGRLVYESSRWAESTIEAWYDEILCRPRTWLLTTGWRLARVERARRERSLTLSERDPVGA